jgi:vesicle-fusing ATPase
MSSFVKHQLTVKVMPGGNTWAGHNRVAISEADFESLKIEASLRKVTIYNNTDDPTINVNIDGKFIYMAFPSKELTQGQIGMNNLMRTTGGYILESSVQVCLYQVTSSLAIASINISIDFFVKKKDAKPVTIEFELFKHHFTSLYNNHVFFRGQKFICIYNKNNLEICVEDFTNINHKSEAAENRGLAVCQYIASGTTIEWCKKKGSEMPIFLNGNVNSTNTSLFKKDFNFQSLGIGGLDSEFSEIFKDIFASRLFPGLYSQLGFSHIKGLLLYGPPGCGKTLIARQIGKILNAKEPKIVNGPEILDKFVGASEEKVRALFADAEKEQKERGDASDLHIIILDEMDAIMKQRGSSRGDTGVADTIVNQFLSKIDGVESLNNVLIIGMTNRKDMIDEAVLRPGRLEKHIEIGLPDEKGRIQILNIKTLNMKSNKRMSHEAIERLPEIGSLTKNFTGAELETLCKRATNFALTRVISDPINIDKTDLDDSKIIVEYHDFIEAIKTTIPAFGNKNQDNISNCFKNGFIPDIGDHFQRCWDALLKAAKQVHKSSRTSLVTVLLEGDQGTGKTAMAAKLAAESDFGFVRMISADTMIGMNETQVCTTIHKVFLDSYRSVSSIILIDDIERLIKFTPVGQRFSNDILQTLLIMLKKDPPSSTKLMIVVTTSIYHLLDNLQFTSIFSIQLNVPLLQNEAEYIKVLSKYAPEFSEELKIAIAKSLNNPISLKQMLNVIEMTLSDDKHSVESFRECLYLVCH